MKEVNMWTAIIVVILLIGGMVAHKVSGKNDSSTEQVIETLLKAENVDVDFSADDKQKELQSAELKGKE